MRTRTRTGALVVAACIALAGCGGGDGDDADDAAATDDATTAEDAGEDDAGGETAGAAVTAVDFAFDPTSVAVGVGDTVTFTNDDGVGHTVTAGSPDEPGDAFDEAVGGGESVEITFDEAGTVTYFCTIHPSMTGEVVVS